MCTQHNMLLYVLNMRNHIFTTLPTVGLMSSQWHNDKTVRVWKIPKPCQVFCDKFDKIQDQLQSISCMDELLSGK